MRPTRMLISRIGFGAAAIGGLIGAVAGFAGTARADEPVKHTVKANETCTGIAQKYYGDGRLLDPIHRANPALHVPPPHTLVEGMVLVIPPKPEPTTGPDAQLTTVRNQVEVHAQETKQGKPNDPLFKGNRVSTQEASAADVTFRDETQVKLGERTLVVILGDQKSAASAASFGGPQASLVTGNLRAFMASATSGTSTSVTTPAANVKVHAGEAQVASDAQKTTRVAVYSGSSSVEARGKTRELTRGFGSKVENGKTPEAPRPLPLAPKWANAPPALLVDRDGTVPPITGSFEEPAPDQHIAEWRVQIARDFAFREIVIDIRVPVTTKKLEAQSPGLGAWFLRVSAIDDDRFEGPWSRSAKVFVMQVRITPAVTPKRRRLEVGPTDVHCVRVGNTKLVSLDGPIEIQSREPIRLRCAGDDGEPTTLLSFD